MSGRRLAGIAAAMVLVLGLLVELAAVPIAERVLGSALGRCLPYEQVEITSVARPVTPGLLVGRARDVEVEATGLQVQGLRLEHTRLHLPLALAPYAPFAPEPPEATLEVTLRDTDLEDFLADQVPFGLQPSVRFRPGQLRVGVPPVEVTAAVRVEDGVLTVAPGGLPPAWWTRLGLEAEVTLPEDLRVDRVELRSGQATATVRVDVVAGVDGSPGCEGPLGSAA